MIANKALTIFQLSRLGAQITWQSLTLTVDRAVQPAGAGVCLATSCDNETIIFWVAEYDWDRWLLQKLGVPPLADTENELLSILANYLLTPLNNWLQNVQLLGINPATAHQANSVEHFCWRISLAQHEQTLSLFVLTHSDRWLQQLLSHFPPSVQPQQPLSLVLGWALLPDDLSNRLTVGDAIAIIGVGDALDEFWLHPVKNSEKIRLLSQTEGQFVDSTETMPDGLAEIPHLVIEVGEVMIDSTELAKWDDEENLALKASRYSCLRLTLADHLWGFGLLVRIGEQWMVRIDEKIL